MGETITLAEAATLVRDGDRIAFGGGGALMRRPLAFTRELIRRGVRDLDVFHFLGGVEIDLLVAAGCIRSTNCAYLGLLEYGQAPSFQRAVRARTIAVNEYSEFSFMVSLKAAEMGIPFIPWKTPWGSDLVAELGLKTIADPYCGQELLALPAIELDVAVIQVARADQDGYVEMPAAPDLVWDYDHLIGRVAKKTIVCAEEIEPLRDPARVALIGREVDHLVEASRGAWPTGMHGLYEPDVEHIVDRYLPAAEAGGELMASYLDEVLDRDEGALRAR